MDALHRHSSGLLIARPYHPTLPFRKLDYFRLIRELSALANVVVLVVLSVICIRKRCKSSESRPHSVSNEGIRRCKSLQYRAVVVLCMCFSCFHFFLCIFNYFWYGNDWHDGKLAIHLDLMLRTFVWLLVCTYLYIDFSHANERKFPSFLRIWWSLFFVFSCASLASDFVYIKQNETVVAHFWILDSVSLVVSLFVCYAGLIGKYDQGYTLLQKPLLNDYDAPQREKHHGSCGVTPYSTSGVLSLLSFSWVGPLIKVGHAKTLDLDDIPRLADSDTAEKVYSVFKAKIEADAHYNGKRSDITDTSSGVGTLTLTNALLFSVRAEILWTSCLSLVFTLASYVGPYLIDHFVQYLNGRRRFKNEGYVLVGAFIIAQITQCLTQRHWFFRLQLAGIRAQAALIAMIFRKGLTLSNQSRQCHSSGEIINFMSVDAERVGDFSWYMHELWLVPLQVILALVILYRNLGIASFAALLATILVMLVNIPLGKLQEKYQEKLMESKDVRMKATSEILRNMRVLKLQGWEMKFLDKIMDMRRRETNWLKKYVYTEAGVTFAFWGAPTFVSVVTFGACMLLGVPLESGKILSALATFRILQEPIYNLPDTISMLVQTKVSLDRISSFVRLEDLQSDSVEKLPEDSVDLAVEVRSGTFSWDPSSEIPTLKELNFRVYRGMRVAVCGAVGSGKSSLLSCILGEIPKISGTVKLTGSKAYVSQSPWIQSGKIQDNILFGKGMDNERYQSVLEACALKKDLQILPFGDQTIIGERGINLSGGQKQRIQIARALYHDSDIYLFDDPFSAVDAHTGTHLFKECLLGFLSSKTVIYVTHQVEFLSYADLVLVMNDGKITQAGKYNEIINSGNDFMELVGAHTQALSTLILQMESSGDGMADEVAKAESDGEAIDSRADERYEDHGETVEIGGQKGQLIQEEEREKGRVGFSVYWKYLTASNGGVLVPFILLAQILFQLLQIGSNYWMAWASPVTKDMRPPVDGFLLIIIYVALALGSSFCILVRALLLVTAGYKTAVKLFNKMHFTIFRAPMSFFDSTPSGRILNRASTDQSAVDISIPFQIGAFAFSLIQLLGIIAVMSHVAWQVFVIFIPVAATCMWYQQYYISAARELARLIGVRKAPNIQHFAESLSGSSTIRCFDHESRFSKTNLVLINNYCRFKFHSAAAMEWLCFRLDVLSAITFALSLIFLISVPEGLISPGIAGLAVTYGLNLNMIQAWVIWNLCNLENKIISVERIFQYSIVQSEPPLAIETNTPNPDWPFNGEISIRDLKVRYAPHMPLVLKGISCTFPGGIKTGIVGRTGSGKSTLLQTLFRIVDPCAGQILIDGVDISTIGLHDLRSRLSIIPQDPTLFEGTIRSNLDPLEIYSDEQIWDVIDKCQLGEVRKKDGKLDSPVNENGENWSVGQRQLVCLGRVILKNSKVLVLDEATASVDTVTDNLIQQTLRQQFEASTVIIIAHRLTSVLDSDIIMLLDNGIIMELDTPAKLLEDKSSLFSKLVAEYTLRSTSSS